MATEVEAKFLAAGPDVLESLAAATHLGPASLGAPNAFDEVDRYLDTDGGHLEAAGWACRLRTRAGSIRVSLKGPPQAPVANAGDRWLHHRPEVEGMATGSLDPSDWPASEARALLDAMRDGHPLRERFRLNQRRTERAVELDGAPVGTLSLDRVSVRRGQVDAGTFHAVELELAADAGASTVASLTKLGAVLAARPGIEPDGRTKLEHALALLAPR